MPHTRRLALLLTAPAVLAACGQPSDTAADSAAASGDSAAGVAVADTGAAAAHGGMNMNMNVGMPPGDTAAPAAPAPALPEPPARDADQLFLRRMGDLHEGMIRVAHTAMEQRHAHDPGNDPALSTDAMQDAVRGEIVALLRSNYKDTHDPMLSPADAAVADSLRKLPDEAFGPALNAFVARRAREEVRLIDRMRPSLRRPEVRALADRLRATHAAEMRAAAAKHTPPARPQ